jgi:hypothetical protein
VLHIGVAKEMLGSEGAGSTIPSECERDMVSDNERMLFAGVTADGHMAMRG